MDTGADSGLAPERVAPPARVEPRAARASTPSTSTSPTSPIPDADRRRRSARSTELAAAGKVAAWGRATSARTSSARRSRAADPSCVQNSFSLLDRGDEGDVIPLCAARRHRVPGFGPLAGGWLTGKYRARRAAAGGLADDACGPSRTRALDSEDVYRSLDALAATAAERGVSTAGLALAWLLAHPRRDLDRRRAADAGAPRAGARGARARSHPGRARRSRLVLLMTPLLVLAEEDVVELLDMEGCIAAMERSARGARARRGDDAAPADGRAPGENHLLGMMPVYRGGERPMYSLKTVAVMPDNPAARARCAPGHGHALRRRHRADAAR